MMTDIAASEDKWCILRTSGSRTIALAASLTEVGFDVWTPIEERCRMAGRERKLVEQRLAILPGYVFAKMVALADLLALSRSPSLNYSIWDAASRRMVTKGHPYFSVFHSNGQVRPQSDRCLAHLRSLEEALAKVAARNRERARETGVPPQFTAGQIVRIGDGGFAGLDLTVVETNAGKTVTLTHPDWTWEVEISAWKLQAIQLEQTVHRAA